MIIGPFPLHFECGWCGHPVFTGVGPFLFDPGCNYQPQILVGHWPPFCPVWPSLGDPNRQFVQWLESPYPLGEPVEGLVILGRSVVISLMSVTLVDYLLIWIHFVKFSLSKGINVPFTYMICALFSTHFALLLWYFRVALWSIGHHLYMGSSHCSSVVLGW